MASTPASVSEQAVASFRAPAARTRRERALHVVLLLATAVALFVLGVLLWDILADGLTRLRLDFITSYTSRFAEQAGIRSGLFGTMSLMILTALTSFPIGVGAAIYLEEFAQQNRWTRLLEANISNLAGVPSVVYGLLGVGVFVYILGLGRSLLAGALTLTLLILPVIIVASREALRAVPQSIRDGGLALGATPVQVTFQQVLPAALPGMLTGTILALSRAIGETAPILVAGAAFSLFSDPMPWDLTGSYTALPIQIYEFVSFPNEEFQIRVSAAAIIVLMVMLLLMNSAAIILRNRYSRKW